MVIDGRPLRIFRFLFGAMMFAAVVRSWANGWVEEVYVKPPFHFHYWGFGWVEAWPAPFMQLLFALMAIAAVLVALGVFYRPAIVTFFLLFTYVELIDATYYLNHYYLISLLSFLMIFLPMTAEKVPSWTLHLLRAQIGLVYFFAGVAKLSSDW